MPEQLTKHPEVTLQVLASAGAQCGAGLPQTILKTCPAESFCKLPGGEICVYGLPEAQRMTQVSAEDWRSVAAATRDSSVPALGAEPLAIAAIGLVLGLLAGFAAGRFSRRA